MIKLSAKEMNIYVTQGLQREGSHRKDKQLDQAIDLALNLAQTRLIEYRLKPDNLAPHKFEINQKYVADIQTLIKVDQELAIYFNGVRSYAYLPYDFSYLLSDKSTVVDQCEGAFTNSINNAAKERIIALPFASASSNAPFFQNIAISISNSGGTQNKTVFNNFEGFATQDEKVFLVDYIIDAFKSLGVEAYWENYKNFYQADTFYIVSRDLVTTASLTVDNTAAQAVTTDNTISTFTGTQTGTVAVNRDTKADFFDIAAYVSKYHKSIPTSPLASMTSNNIVVVGEDKRFLVSKIFVNYIRKPKRINLALNQGSELSATTHQAICDLAVLILRKQLDDVNFPLEVQDSEQRIKL